MIINTRTLKPSVNPEEMKTSDKIAIDTIIKDCSKHLSRAFDKSKMGYNILKTHIYVDYVDAVFNEETETYEYNEEDVYLDFHPNMYLLYTDAERSKILDFVKKLEAFNDSWKEISNNIPSLFDPISRLEAIE